MVSHPLTNHWNYDPVIVRCPCGVEMPVEDAEQHGFEHWKDLPRD